MRKLDIPARRIPLFGALVNCREKDHISAMREVWWSLVIAFLPILIVLVIYVLFQMPDKVSFRVQKLAEEGQIFLVSAAIVGPLCYTALRSYLVNESDRAEFPHKHAFLFSYVVIVGTCVISFVLIDLSDSLSLGIKPNAVFHWTSALAVGYSVLLIYLSTVYRNALSSFTANDMTKNTEAFVSDWEKFCD